MLYYFKIYILLISISIKSQLKYKLDFIIQLIVWMIYSFIPIISIDILIMKFGNLGNWDSSLLFISYSIIMFSYDFSRMVGRGFDNFHNYVENGKLDIILVRPWGISLQILGNDFFLRRLSGILTYLILLIISISKLNIEFNKFYIFVCIMFLSLSTIFIFFSLLYISSIFTIIFRKRNFISSIIFDKAAFVTYLPLNLLNKVLKYFFTFIVPMYYCYFVPLDNIFNYNNSQIIFFSIFKSLIFSTNYLFISKIMFIKILRKFYTSKGN